MASLPPSLTFTVRRKPAVLVPPAVPTPHEFKLLSDIDDQESLRFQIPLILVYRCNHPLPSSSRDPAATIRHAISRALVPYYPFAGRLREGPASKLSVECTGEGILFVEADADVHLDQFGDLLQPPFPCLDELLFDVPGSSAVLGTPLLLVQVTRLACGGFIFALRLNHTMSDGSGLVQFMSAVGEMARGFEHPSVAPVWERELLNARDPPRVTCVHREYEEVPDIKGTIVPLCDMTRRSFFFGPQQLAALRQRMPMHLCKRSTFEILTGCLWRCWAVAIGADPDEEVRIVCTLNARAKFSPPLPSGYYGNALAFPVAITTAARLCENPLGYAVELVGKAKACVTEEYMHSLADLMMTKGRPLLTAVRCLVVSDVSRLGFGEVDFGWGKPVYGGPAEGAVGHPGGVSFYIPYRNGKGENGLVVPVCLQAPAMKRFVLELEAMTKELPSAGGGVRHGVVIPSSL